jgi:hypothetical protein
MYAAFCSSTALAHLILKAWTHCSPVSTPALDGISINFLNRQNQGRDYGNCVLHVIWVVHLGIQYIRKSQFRLYKGFIGYKGHKFKTLLGLINPTKLTSSLSPHWSTIKAVGGQVLTSPGQWAASGPATRQWSWCDGAGCTESRRLGAAGSERESQTPAERGRSWAHVSYVVVM